MHLALAIGPFVEFGVRVRCEHQNAQKQKPPGTRPEGLIAALGHINHRL
jgi:hypothetical protein